MLQHPIGLTPSNLGGGTQGSRLVKQKLIAVLEVLAAAVVVLYVCVWFAGTTC